MKKFLSFISLGLLVGLFALSGCKKDKTPAPEVRTKSPTRRAAQPKPAAMSGTWAVKAYEVVRLALAADDLAAAQKGATALATEAKTQSASAQAGDKTATMGMEKAATALAAAKDIAAARLEFGNLSKQVISFVSGAPTRAKGLTAYQCPMAKGYKKWVQADAKMANPYMGKKMLLCGGKTKLTP